MSQEETADEQASEIIELRAEVERLRAVLQEIARGKVASDYDDLRLTAARVCGIARRALDVAQPEGPEKVPEDSPNSVPKELEEFKARGYERINRTAAQPEEKK